MTEAATVEARERLEEASKGDWIAAPPVFSSDLRALLTSYEAQGERLRVLDEALEKIAYGLNGCPRGLLAGEMRKAATAALTQRPATENGE